MKKLFPLPLMLPLLLLASCSSADVGHEKFLVDRSGDLLLSTASTYATIGNQRSYGQMISAMDKGETVLFTFASFNCSHCHEFESTYIQYLRDYKPNMYIYYLTDVETETYAEWNELIDALGDYFGIEGANQNPFRYTPTIFIANKAEGYFSIDLGNLTRQYVENSIKNHADFSNLYYFSSFANYPQVDSSDVLTILYSEELDTDDRFHESIYPLAQSSSKDTYVLDYDTMDEEEQSAALAYFGLSEYSLSYSLNGETIKEEDALSYYGASSN